MKDSRGYIIDYEPIVGPLEILEVQRLIDETTEQWYNRTLCKVDDAVVRLGVLQGEFHWHKHDEQDEFFFVLDGLMRIELEGRQPVELGPREAFVVPKGLMHRPVVPVRTAVLMIERAEVVATGD
ncbi:MAG TPA: cupin domain-containing protein [Candidatus Dormibacteraeota bacterium]|nr:cupin domain-containing protein [Candidatus Dormibacteraeota bacterium]